jgi:hypothetical protein
LVEFHLTKNKNRKSRPFRVTLPATVPHYETTLGYIPAQSRLSPNAIQSSTAVIDNKKRIAIPLTSTTLHSLQDALAPCQQKNRWPPRKATGEGILFSGPVHGMCFILGSKDRHPMIAGRATQRRNSARSLLRDPMLCTAVRQWARQERPRAAARIP